MKGGFQKVKLGRKTSAASTSKERPLPEKEDRLQQLKAKIEKDRDVMRKTGKRFNKQGEVIGSQSTIPGEKDREQKIETISMTTPFFRKQTRNTQSATSQEQQAKVQAIKVPPPERKNIKLTELIPSSADKQLSMESSRVFDKEISEQKNRNQQIHKFLSSINLQEFAEGVINMGYDELSVLVEIKAEELNFLMMRAPQQRRLTEALKNYREKNGIEQQKAQLLMDKPSTFKTKVKNTLEKRQVQTASHPYRPKSAMTQASTIPTNNSSLFTNSAFFCSIGGNEWSMDSLIRRACSSCFKVLPSSQLSQRSECYYCKECLSVEQDLLGLSLSDSMVRDYSG